MLLLQGCMSTVKNQAAFDRLRQRQGLGHFYYIGTKDDFHYFASAYFMEPTRYYRYPKAEYPIRNEFPKTKEKDKWVRFIVDWARGMQYFKGEPPEPLR